LSVISTFGDLFKIDRCTDMVTAIDNNQCSYYSSLVITVSLAINIFCCVALYLCVKYMNNKWVINILASMSIIANVVILSYSLTSVDNVDVVGYAVYTCGVGIFIGLLFVGVYNQLRCFLLCMDKDETV